METLGNQNPYIPDVPGERSIASIAAEARTPRKKRNIVLEAFRRRSWRETAEEQRKISYLNRLARRAMRTVIRLGPISTMDRWQRRRLLRRMERTSADMTNITRSDHPF